MSAQHIDRRQTGSFHRPASYGVDARDAAPRANVGGGGASGSDETRPFSASELDDARSEAPTDGHDQAGERSVDQTLVSPLAPGRVRADVQIPDPAYPPRRQPQLRRQPEARAGRPESPQQQPLQRRRPPARRPEPYASPAMATDGYDVAYQSELARPPREHGHGLARGLLLLASWLLRLSAWALVALVLANSFTLGNRVTLMHLTERATQLLPSSLAGLYVLDTPFGGAFRGDLAIMAIIMFVLDWICARIRRRLR